MKNDLENNFGVISYKLEPFSEQVQIHYLVEFWKLSENYEIKSNDNDMINKAKKIINGIKMSINDREKELTGIPLQLKMLAEIYLDNDKIAKNLTLKTLFDEFMKKKIFKIQQQEKKKLNLNDPQLKEQNDEIYKN